MKKIIILVLRIFSNFIPVRKDKICFIANPDFSDGPQSMYLYIKEHYPNFKLVWIVNKNYKSSVICYKKNSIRSYIAFWSSKIIFTSMGDYLKLARKCQIYCNLWHGIPIKAIYHDYNKEEFKKRKLSNVNWNKANFFVSSNLVKKVFQKSFNLDEFSVHVTGQPRNDFYQKESDISKLLGINKDFYNILYAPTFDELNNGVEDLFYQFSDYKYEDLINYIEKNNIYLYCKYHPRVEKTLKTVRAKHKNIKIIDSNTLINNNLTVNDLIFSFDKLVTDYSSLCFDFMYLNKPTLFISSQYELFRKCRGVSSLEKNQYLYSREVFDFNSFLKFLKDNYVDNKVLSDIYQFNDNNNSKRVFDVVISLAKFR